MHSRYLHSFISGLFDSEIMDLDGVECLVSKDYAEHFYSGQKKVTPGEPEEEGERKTLVTRLEMLRYADHVAWYRKKLRYYHHAIVLDIDPARSRIEVISYMLSVSKRPIVERRWVNVDLAKRDLYRIDYDRGQFYPPDVVINRALSRLGETKYDVIDNNCEHFTRWAKTGANRSRQVEEFKRYFGMKVDSQEPFKGPSSFYTTYHVPMSIQPASASKVRASPGSGRIHEHGVWHGSNPGRSQTTHHIPTVSPNWISPFAAQQHPQYIIVPQVHASTTTKVYHVPKL